MVELGNFGSLQGISFLLEGWREGEREEGKVSQMLSEEGKMIEDLEDALILDR